MRKRQSDTGLWVRLRRIADGAEVWFGSTYLLRVPLGRYMEGKFMPLWVHYQPLRCLFCSAGT